MTQGLLHVKEAGAWLRYGTRRSSYSSKTHVCCQAWTHLWASTCCTSSQKKSQVADDLGKANTSALVTVVTHTLYLQIVRVTIFFQKYVLAAEVEAYRGQEPPHSLTGVIVPTEGIPDPQYQFSQWNSLISSHCACNSLRLSIGNRFHFNNHNITVIFFQSCSLLLLNSEHIKKQ